MGTRENLLYTKEHEWVSIDDDLATIGITDYAQSELGDIVFLELPEIGLEVRQMETFGTIEAVKAVSNLFSPVSGIVVKVNTNLQEEPEQINTDPYGEGWVIQIQMKDKTELANLLSPGQYRELIGE